MTLKAWIDDIKSAEGGSESEARLEQASAPETGKPIIRCGDYSLPGEKEADWILFVAVDMVLKIGVYNGKTPECRAAETEVNRTYKAILDGGRDFAALREACAQWIEAATSPPAPPDTVSLFEGSGK